MELRTTVNGEPRTTEVDGAESAVEVIRDGFGLTGTKLVCGSGVCGACTVLVDGRPLVSCLTPATRLREAQVTTVEGLADGDTLHPVQAAFAAHDALQCGYCTPGFVVDAVAFVDRWRAEHGDTEPDRHTIAEALAGHLCRCGAYEGIYRAVAAACRGEHDGGSGSVARVDAPDKVTGAATYTTDVRLPGMLHGAIRRSDVAAGTVAPFSHLTGAQVIDLMPADRRIRWAGQPLAAVVAETPLDARHRAAELSLSITTLPFVVDPDKASAVGAPEVYAERADRKLAPSAAEGATFPGAWHGNRRGPTMLPFLGTVAKRRLSQARSQQDQGLVELDFDTAPQLHSSFEPHCAVADWSQAHRLRVWVSTQAVEGIRQSLSEATGLAADDIEVIAEHVGGGFGSKLSLGVETLAAVRLSKATGRPVSVVLDRHEELTATGNRPGSASRVSLLLDEAHDIRALQVEVDNHAGIAIGNSVGALAMMVYDRTPRLARDTDVVTNAPPGAPFRGPGGPTYAWALEQTVDEAAHRHGRDPIELRAQWDGNERRQALYRWAQDLPVWRERGATGSRTGRFRRGVGVAAGNWFYFVDPSAEVVVGVEDGRLTVSTASQDMGTGSRTVLARAVAQVFDVEPTDVWVRLGRSGSGTTYGPTSGGSRTTVSLWPTAVEAATTLRGQIGDQALSEHEGARATATRGGDLGRRAIPFDLGGMEVGRGFSAAVHVSEVEVDTRTGKTRVLAVHGGIAVGRIHAPGPARSQCEGSIIQGIGLALYEQQVLDPHTGLTLTANLEDYRIPQLGDTPEIDIHFHEEGWEHVPGGGIGLGEIATISPAASVGNAIHHALGVRTTTLPVRPDRLLEALR